MRIKFSICSVSTKIKTLEDLVKAVFAKIYHHERNCRCRNCHAVGMVCLECPDCRTKMEDEALAMMRSVNRPPS